MQTRVQKAGCGTIIIQPNGTNCNAVGVTAEIHSFTVGIPAEAAKLAGVLFSPCKVILAGAAGLRAGGDVAATASATFTTLKTGSAFATFNFAAAASTATFTVATDTTFDVGDRLTISAPSAPTPHQSIFLGRCALQLTLFRGLG